ncbi:hypothetical protein [Flavobacterium sp. 3HN19-14]|uniref:hypothetical protein n=1 Tax=Flavobacterium sp. 3HN19-14 TaxID=3448133 RepID=UPI003EDF8BAB
MKSQIHEHQKNNIPTVSKTLKFIILGVGLLIATSAQSQVSVSVNIGTRPDWAPAAPVAVNYYYLPDVDSYYDVRESRYIYYGGGRWNRVVSLPAHYNYNPYRGRTIVLTDYHGNTPYKLHKIHKTRYCGPQTVIVKQKHHGHGRGRGRGHWKH